MKHYIYIFIVLLLVSVSCKKEEVVLEPSKSSLVPNMNNTELDRQIQELYKDYNLRVEYRYIENLLPIDWYYITPANETIVYPICKMLFDAWITPLEQGASKEFVQKTFPKQIVLVGSTAQQKDGTVVLGQAEGGTLIRFTEANKFTPTNVEWMRRQLKTAYHEYCHILHQTFILPDEFREVTPNEYTRSAWQTLKLNDAIRKGMVTPYGTSNFSEDFVELFACYITYQKKDWEYCVKDEELPDDLKTLIPKDKMPEDPAKLKPMIQQAVLQLVSRNDGRIKIRKKFQILEKFLTKQGVDIHTIRTLVQQYFDNASVKKP